MAKLKTFNDIRKKEWKQKAKEIKAAGNKVLLFVHPYYSYATPKYKKVVDGLMAKSKVPIIILSPHPRIERTKKRLAGIGAPEHMMIATEPDDPATLMKVDRDGNKTFDYKLKALMGKLEEMGVEEVHIGGQFATMVHHPLQSPPMVIDHERRWLPGSREVPEKTITGSCVGAVYEKLIYSNKFEKVRLIPNAVHSHKPKYPLTPEAKARKKARKKRK